MFYGYGFGFNYKSSGVAFDPDAQAFITAASITDPTQQSAVNQLVLDLKGYSLWAKMKAVYPFVGGSSTSNSYNLVNTALYQITWSGGLTHNADGVTGSINGYGNTGIAPSSVLNQDSTHVSVFIKTASASSSRSPIGSTGAGYANGVYIYPKASNLIYFDVNASSGGSNTLSNTTETGFFTISRTNGTQQSAYRNGSSLGTSTRNSAGLSSQTISILSNNVNGTNSDYYNIGTLSLSTIGDGLDATEASNLYTAVNTFNTTLGR